MRVLFPGKRKCYHLKLLSFCCSVLGRKRVNKEPILQQEEKEMGGIKKKSTRKAWPEFEKHILVDYFKGFIKGGQVPGKSECEKFLAVNESNIYFSHLSWKDIKYGVYNQILKVKQRKFHK